MNVDDPQAKLAELIAQRYPIYAEADITIDSDDCPPELTVQRVIAALQERFVPAAAARRGRPLDRRDICESSCGARSYEILVGAGLLGQAGRLISPVAQRKARRSSSPTIASPICIFCRSAAPWNAPSIVRNP